MTTESRAAQAGGPVYEDGVVRAFALAAVL